MNASGIPRLLAACVHAGAAASILILARETIGFRWVSPPDPMVCVAAVAAILFTWWRPPRFARKPWIGVKFGLVAAAATSVITLVLLILHFVGWLGDTGWRPGYGGGFWVMIAMVVVETYGVLLIGTMTVACVVGGSLGSLAADVATRFGRPGLMLAAIFAAAGLIVPAGAAYARVKAGAGFIDLVTRHDVVRPFPAKVAVALIVHGERVLLERTVLCRRHISNQVETDAKRGRLPKPYWLPNIKSFGHVFADGSGIFVLTPNGCKDLAIAREKSAGNALGKNILPIGYRPLVGWTRDSAELSDFDLYIDGTAFVRPDAAVRVESVTMYRVPYDSQIDALDRFAVIGWPDSRSKTAYSGYFAVAIPRGVWEGYRLARDELQLMSELGFVFGNYRYRNGLPKEGGLPAGTRRPFFPQHGAGIPDGPSRLAAGYGRQGSKIPVAGPVIPLRRTENGWRLNPAETGVLALYRGLQTTPISPPSPRTIAIGARTVQRTEDRATGRYLYDPVSGILYSISFTDFRIARPKGVLASRKP